MNDHELLCRLSDAFGPPGFEAEVRAFVRGLVEPLGEVKEDVLGNLLVRLPAKKKGLPVAMLDCHLDEVGFMVSAISDQGFLSIVPLGGWDERIVPGSLLTIVTRDGSRVVGSLGTSPPHILPAGEKKVIPLSELFCDVGAGSAEEAAALGLSVGDPAVIHYPARPLGRQGDGGEPAAIVGKAFDNRAGCAALVRLLERFAADPPDDLAVAASFSVAEEVGLRGARAAAWTLEPAFALALEGTVAGDVPGVPPALSPSRQGAGAAITAADRTLIVRPDLVALAERLAGEAGIPWQIKTPASGGTDAGEIHLSRGGVPAMVLSVPCRYIHSAVSTLRLADFRAVVDLAGRIVRAAGSLPYVQRRPG